MSRLKTSITITAFPEVAEGVMRYANSADRSRSWVVTQAIIEYLERHAPEAQQRATSESSHAGDNIYRTVGARGA